MSDIENIPEEMKQYDMFCFWKYKMEDGKNEQCIKIKYTTTVSEQSK